MDVQHRYVLFADIKGFTKIDEAELPTLMGDVWTKMASILEPYEDAIVTYNTWGDSLFLVFKRASVVEAIIEMRDWFRSHESLAIRIACHFGDFYEYPDPILKRSNAVGANINLTARIEPITRPNSIFVTKAFKDALTTATDTQRHTPLEFDDLGEIELAKQFGEEELFLLRRSDEEKHILDRLAQMELGWALPDIDKMNDEQSEHIEELKPLSGRLLRQVDTVEHDLNRTNAAFGMSLARLHQNAGNYDRAYEIIENLVQITLDADGLNVAPLRQQIDFVKLKANNATRRGEYHVAHNLLYDLYKSGAQDTDTLTMLASCYKRRAFYDENGQPYAEPIVAMLERSRDLYLEAVRKDVGDYYPIINAAYAHAFLNDNGIANKLARYCSDLLRESRIQDWWMASTYAETEVLQSDYEEAERRLKLAISDYQPNTFQKDALVDQLKLLALVRKDKGLSTLIASLESNAIDTKSDEHPWQPLIGIFAEDPDWDEFQESIRRYRDEIDRAPDED